MIQAVLDGKKAKVVRVGVIDEDESRVDTERIRGGLSDLILIMEGSPSVVELSTMVLLFGRLDALAGRVPKHLKCLQGRSGALLRGCGQGLDH